MSENPLIPIAYEYIEAQCEDCPEEAVQQAKQSIRLFILKKITFQECKLSLENTIHVADPAIKINNIINIANNPEIPTNSTLHFSEEPKEKTESGRRKARLWTPDEDMRLLAGIYKYGLESWSQIVKFVGNGRTRPQCTQRWNRGLNPKISKSIWTDEENQQLLKLVNDYGETVWSKIAEVMGNRSDVQCRYHFFQLKKSSKQHEKPHKPRAQKMMLMSSSSSTTPATTTTTTTSSNTTTPTTPATVSKQVSQQQEKENIPEQNNVTSDENVLSLDLSEPSDELDLTFPNVHFDEPVMPFFDALQDSFLEGNLAFNYFDL